MNSGKIVLIAAPSGCGKSTIISALIKRGLDIVFSVSATTRPPRDGEKEGVNYYFITEEEFRAKIDAGAFLEYEQVYPGRYYGTLRSEIERITSTGKNIILDLDVNGALNVKAQYGNRAIALFIAPPSLDVLRQRLVSRGTETVETVDVRISRARYELSRAPEFDCLIVNDELKKAVDDTYNRVAAFLTKES